MIIRNIHRPNILLEDIKVKKENEYYFNEESKDTYTGIPNRGIDFEKYVGLHNFFININGMTILSTSVEICTINLNDKYPTINLRIQPDFGEFLNFGLPKDGDIISIFYKSTIEDLKPLRLDFIITDIKNEKDLSFVIFGVINIPKLFNDSSFFKEDTSLNTLIELSKEMKLGFSTNETETNDKQIWLCANKPFDLYLDDIKNHSWKNERSFYDSFIDMYYNLNFVNVFDQLSNETEKKVNLGIYKLRDFIETSKYPVGTQTDDELEFVLPTVLHNWKYTTVKEETISELGILNESSRISLEEGYQKYSHFYDFTLDEKVELLNEALSSKGKSKEYIPLKGNLFDEKWKENTRHVWSGISYSLPDHNVHPLYYQSELHNKHNLKEIDKFTIQVTLENINFNLYRYMIVPILWYEYGALALKLRNNNGNFNSYNNDESLDAPYVLNEFISGFYVLKGFHLDYIGPSDGNSPIIQQRLILTRTEWPKTFIVTDSNDKVVTNLPMAEN